MKLFDESEVREVRAALTGVHGPQIANFEILQTPKGSAPLCIREGWLGIVLPLRSGLLLERGGNQAYQDILSGTIKKNEQAIPVAGLDAVFALAEQDREQEVAFWFESGLAYGTFVFRAHEGLLRPLVTIDTSIE